MSDPKHEIFKRIILHNRLLSEQGVESLLAEAGDPEAAVERLVATNILSKNKAGQLLAIYHKQLQKHHLEEGPSPSSASLESESEMEGTAAEGLPAGEMPEEAPQDFLQGGPAAGEELPPPAPLPEGGAGLIHCLLLDARRAGASDLHVKGGMRPVIRVCGQLRELDRPEIPADVVERALLEILDDEHRTQFLESWDLDFCYDAGEQLGRYRANFLRQHRGTDAIFRAIPNRVPSLDELNLPPQVKKFVEYRVGIVLVTGPKGCGKTTTLAAMVDLINSARAEHIITIEDPIEFVHPCKRGHVNQRQVGLHTKSFSNALRSALREAPDVIMVGEMRDLETTSLAITAAETGHLVLATLHTPDALRTIGRVLDVFPPKEQSQIRAMLSESLRGIVSQLLLPGADGTSMQLAVEILVNTQAIGHLIREAKVHQIPGLMQTGKQYGMILMDESLIRLVKEGKITKDAAMAHANNVKLMQKELAS